MKAKGIMMNKLMTALIACALSFAATAVELKADHPERYVVKKGDTLWDISEHFLNDPWLWPEIWMVNPQVANPHLIFPGDVLTLVYIDGKPRIVKARVLGGTTKLSPTARVLSEGDAIPTIPLNVIKPFLSGARIVSDETIETAPYVLANEYDFVNTVEDEKMYGRGFDAQDEEGVMYSIFRKGRRYVDPETEEVLGVEAIHKGKAELTINADPATLMVDDSVQDIRQGDFMQLVDEEYLHPTYFPRKPDSMIKGSIISVYDGVSQIGQYDVVVINRGEREGVEVGHVFTVRQAGRVVKDRVGLKRDSEGDRGIFKKMGDFVTGETLSHNQVKLPDEDAGQLMVFRTFEKVSIALVMRANRPIHVLDTVVTPE